MAKAQSHLRPIGQLPKFLLSSWIFLSAQVSSHAQETQPPKIEAFGSPFGALEQASNKQARVYAWRNQQTGSSQPVNLYLNGRYHASLLKGGYTQFCLKPEKLNLQSATDDAGQMHVGKNQAGLTLEPQTGQVVFLRVKDTGPFAAQIDVVPAAQALPELRLTRQQIHTHSRAPAVQECDKEPMAAPPAPALPPAVTKTVPPREYALQTDALFEFGKAELRADGFNAIESLVHDVQKDYSSIDRIRVVGYTDAIGPLKLNQKLSSQRAYAVADHLRARGLRPKLGIEAEGRWSLELAKPGCGNSPSPANKICHAPNRRVVIVIYGARRS